MICFGAGSAKRRSDQHPPVVLRADDAPCATPPATPSVYSTVTCALAVGPQPRHLSRPAGPRPAARRGGGPVQIGSGMRTARLVAGEAEHHPLVAGTLGVELVTRHAVAELLAPVDALGDVRALLVDRDDDPARRAVEAVQGVVVADRADRLAGQLGDVDVRRRGDLAGNHAQARREEGLGRPRDRQDPRRG